ncbi:MAG TPA: Ig-like domain-containing protein, partial [Saprospiraceae bacterium]|nr:Ig-like domain-containing protein [Saprospiraceae bacterium]
LGNDFSNSFTMGSPTQLYNGNLPQVGSPGPVMTGLDFDLAQNLTLTPHFASRSCGGNNNYVWTGPQGFSSVNQGIFIANFSPAFQGYFQLKAYNKEGCMRDYTIPVFYENQPTPDTAVCPGSSLVLSGAPADINGIPGIWQAVGNGAGELIAMSGGKALLKINDQAAVGKYGYQYTVDNKSYEISIEVNGIPPVPLSICPLCEGDTLALPTPPSMTWQTDYNPLVFDSYEVVKILGDSRAAAVKSGNALLQLKNDITGCISKPLPVKVLPSKVSLVGNSTTICVNSTFQFLPSTGGTWTSNSPAIATINNSGLATAIAEGEVTFTYRPVVPVCGTQLLSPVITVIGNSGAAFTGPNSICVGDTTTLSPTTGGVWVSANTAVATVNNHGLITGVSPGTTTFSFTSNNTGCTSHLQTPVFVDNSSNIILDVPERICVGQHMELHASVKGKWTSTVDIVLITGAIPFVLGADVGYTDLIFTPSEGVCKAPIIVKDFEVIWRPIVSIVYPFLCENEIGKATVVCKYPGYWESLTPTVCSIDTDGNIKCISPGEAYVMFTEGGTGCASEPGGPTTFSPVPTAEILSNDTVCVGEEIFLTASTNGVWVSSNTQVVKMNNQGVGTTLKEGLSDIYFQSVPFRCNSDTFLISVLPSDSCEIKKYYTYCTVFADLNQDGVFTPPSEFVLPNAAINISGINTTYFTDENGNADIKLDSGQFTFTVSMPYGLWQENPVIKTLLVNKDKDLLIGFIPQSGVISAFANQTTDFLRCNRYAKIHNTATNTGTSIINGTMTVRLDERVYIRNISPTPLGKTDSTIVWNISQLLPGQKLKASFEAFVPNPISNNDSLRFAIQVKEDNDSSLFQNNFAHLIRCSYDPNDLQVRPDRIGEENLTLRTEALTYQVRFQNTGNDTAFYVRIDDVLHKDIDRRSLMLIDASHKGRMILCSNDTLCYIMDTIQLVDDKTHYDASQGYVVFTAKTKFDITEGTVVPNQAHIFFDANAPVITNAVKNTIVTSLPCPDNALSQDGPWLVATEGGNQYTWIDCSNDQILEVSDVPLYKPEQNGSYRVSVKGDYCTVESACIPFVVNSVADITNDVLIYPTLVNDVLYIQSEQAIEKITLGALSGVLHTLSSQVVGNNLLSVTLPAVPSGYYVVTVVTKGGVYTKAVVKM